MERWGCLSIKHYSRKLACRRHKQLLFSCGSTVRNARLLAGITWLRISPSPRSWLFFLSFWLHEFTKTRTICFLRSFIFTRRKNGHWLVVSLVFSDIHDPSHLHDWATCALFVHIQGCYTALAFTLPCCAYSSMPGTA